MKKKVLFFISIVIGLYVCYQGLEVLTFSARGESIYRLGMLIPAKDFYLNLYGYLFLVVGILFLLLPNLFKNKQMFAKKVHKTNNR